MEEEGKFMVEKFNSQNYQLLKMQMEDYLYQKDLFLPLGGKAKQSATMKTKNERFLTERHGNNTVVPDFISGFQYFKRKDNEGCDECID